VRSALVVWPALEVPPALPPGPDVDCLWCICMIQHVVMILVFWELVHGTTLGVNLNGGTR
jgi:hypothetical protein